MDELIASAQTLRAFLLRYTEKRRRVPGRPHLVIGSLYLGGHRSAAATTTCRDPELLRQRIRELEDGDAVLALDLTLVRLCASRSEAPCFPLNPWSIDTALSHVRWMLLIPLPDGSTRRSEALPAFQPGRVDPPSH